MKRMMMMIAMMVTIVASASAMSYSEARQQALFLTDKMAYELNLSDDQYEAAYEINLDYLLSSGSNLYGSYWRRRNADLQYVLSRTQYSIYSAANYFLRPIYFVDNMLNFRIYQRYPDYHKFYRVRPYGYSSYRGGHNRISRYYADRRWSHREMRHIEKMRRHQEMRYRDRERRDMRRFREFEHRDRGHRHHGHYAPERDYDHRSWRER
uniref:DUF3300 domain-containing protein n=1 Tax=Prevotella sp. GTC17260 TaxID=3236796 RepID=A0AB33JAV1_9BACT